jgi:iron/manganese superoxide dismutase-like protein
MTQYKLPDLPYDFGALEPHVSGKIMELHHGKHHAGYVKNANATLERLDKARDKEQFDRIPALERSLAFNLSGYLNGNGTGSPNTGAGFAATAGYRFGFIAPYVAYDFFESFGCSAGGGTATQLAACEAQVDSANSRNLKAGLNLFFNKNSNHVNIELGINHGLSAYGPSSITAPTAGYVPTSLDPLTPGGPRRPFTNSLANSNFKSLVVQWTMYL